MSAPNACDTTRSMLSALLDGDLAPEYEAAVRAHLAACPACRAELDLLEQVVGALRRLPDLPPPAGILAGVRAGIAPRRRRLRDLGRGWLLGVPVGAFATVLVVLGVALFQSRFPGVERAGKVEAPAKVRAPATDSPAPEAEQPVAVPEREEASERTVASSPKSEPAATKPPAAPRPLRDEAGTRASSAAPAAAPAAAPVAVVGDARQDGAARPAPAPPPAASPDRGAAARFASRPAPSTVGEAPAREGHADRPASPVEVREQPMALARKAAREAPVATEVGAKTVDGRRAAAPAPVPRAAAVGEEAWRRSLPEPGGTGPGLAAQRKAPPPAGGITRRPLAESVRDVDRVGAISAAVRSAGSVSEEADDGEREPLEVLYVWAGDGDDLADLRGILGREGGSLLEVRAIDPATGRQELMPLQEQMIPTSDRVRGGWEIDARMPRDNFRSFLDAVQRRPGYQVLQRQAAPPARGRPGDQRVKIRLYR